MLTATVNYGLIQKGQDYLMLSEGYDWYLLKIQGKAFYAFKWVFGNG